MKHILALTLLALLLEGCATSQIMMVNSEGKVYPCAEKGTGGIGGLFSRNSNKTCVQEMEKAGYVKIPDVLWGVHMPSWETSPAKVQRVDAGSPAQIAGIKKGDVIRQLDKRPVSNAKQILSILAKKKPGETLVAQIEREGNKMDIVSTVRAK